MRRNGAPSSEQHDDDDGGDRDRPAHDDDGHAVPEAVLDRPWCGPAAQRPGVDAVAEGGQQRRQHDHREQAGQDGDGHAGVGEAAQEGEREDEQGAAATRPRCRALKATVRPAVRDGADDGRVRLVPAGQLLPVAGDDEQAVVDGQAEAHGGGEVEGEDRDLGDLGRGPAARGTCRRSTARRWPAGSSAATTLRKTNSSRSERDRQGDHLGPQQVLLDGVVDLAEHLGEAADGHGRRPSSSPVNCAADAPRRASSTWSSVALDAGQHERLGAVLGRPQRRGVAEASSRRRRRPTSGSAASSSVRAIAGGGQVVDRARRRPRRAARRWAPRRRTVSRSTSSARADSDVGSSNPPERALGDAAADGAGHHEGDRVARTRTRRRRRDGEAGERGEHEVPLGRAPPVTALT